MLQNHLKQGFRLNRTLGFSLFLYLVVFVTHGSGSLFKTITAIALGLMTLVFLLFNEGAIRLIKRMGHKEPLFMEKLGIFGSVSALIVLSLFYVGTRQGPVLLFCLLPVLQAQFFGQNRLSKAMFGAVVLWFTLSLLSPPIAVGPAWLGVLMILPFVMTLFQYGTMVSHSVRITSSQMNRLQSLAATDGLTGLINRRQFNHQLQGEIARARRHAVPLSLALFDIDNFKKINDAYGHPVGDRILKELGAIMSKNVRESDIAARYGGEEFALILPETRQTEAFELLERLRAMVERTVFCLPDTPITLTISVGVAQLDWESPTAFTLVERADAALYEAKKQGKNRVIYGYLPTPKVTLQKPTGRSIS